MKRLLFLAPLLFLAGCAQPPAEPAKSAADPAKEEAAIRATDDQWQASIKARDAAKAASFWADDAQVILPGTGVMTGRAVFNKFAEDAFKDKNFNITWKTEKIEVAQSGDLAYQTATETVSSTQGKKVMTSQARGIVIWKKQGDGSWKAIVDQSIDLPAAAPMKAATKK
jgi:uncharacterized protein (TIGR02246 family)